MSETANPKLTILHTECSTGSGGQVLRILRESRLLAARGHRLSIACRPDSELSRLALEAGLPVYHFPFPIRGAFGPGLIFSLARRMRQIRPDVVNTHSSVDSWAGGMAARLARVPVVVRTRHIHSAVQPTVWNRFLYGRIADGIITTGERVADILASELNLPRAHFISIPTGIDLTRFTGRGERARIRAEWGLEENQPAIGIVAALRGMKNHRLFLQTAAKLRPLWPEARFFIIGEGGLRASLEAYCADLGLSEVVRFTGQRLDIPDVLAALDLVVLCSSRGEGVPQVLGQALAMKRPVVSTDVGSASEVVRQEITGLLVEPENAEALAGAVDRLLRDPALGSRLANSGRELVEQSYSEEKMVDAVEALFQSLYLQKRNPLPSASIRG